MEQKFASFSLDKMNKGNQDSKIKDSTLSVKQIASIMAPWSHHHSVCTRLNFSNFSSVEHTDRILFSIPNPIAHRMAKTQFPNHIAHRMTKTQYHSPIAHRMTKSLLSFGHSVGNRVNEILSFDHTVGNRILLSFGHSVGNWVKEIHSCACPLCWNKLTIMTCARDSNLKVFHDRWFCYNLGMTMELYLFLVSKVRL